MTPTHPTGQDAVVAVLQNQQSQLEAAVRDLASTMSAGFAAMNAKMDRVNDIALSIAQMSARQEAHSDGLQRAFNGIRSVQESMEGTAEELHAAVSRITTEHVAYVERHGSVHNDIDKRLATAKGVFIGATAAYSLLVALLTWAASTYISETRTNTDNIHQLQLEAAKRGAQP